MTRKKLFTRKRILKILQAAIIIYAVAGILLWQFQEMLLFQSKDLPMGYEFQFEQPHKEILIHINEHEKLDMVQFYPADKTHIKGVVLYFHGNRENINRYARFVPAFTSRGYEVWMPDYPGYGKTTGMRKEQRFYSDAEAVYKMARKRVGADSIIVYGKSLGTAFATELASYSPCKRLILETPYYSMPSLAADHFPIYPAARMVRYQFPLYEFLQNVKVPVTVFHGTGDDVIPISHSLRLKPLLKKSDEYFVIENGEHNNLSEFELYQQKLDSLLRL